MSELKRLACLLSVAVIVGCAGPKIMISTIDKPEVMAWGNLTGIRVDGQLMPFKTIWGETIKAPSAIRAFDRFTRN
jgi:hypothetical protein